MKITGRIAVLMGLHALGCSDAPAPKPSSATGGEGGAANAAGTTNGGAAGSTLAGAGGAPTAGNGGSVPAAAGSAGAVAGGGAAGASGSAGASGGGGGTSGSGGAPDEGWTSLFNGENLDGWTASANAGPLFAVAEIDGDKVIQVYPTQADQSDQPNATLRTNESYSSYVFHLEYKWGTKRFSDRKQTDRDNGICFHICGNAAQVWPHSVELQLGSQAWPGDWVVGNIFMLIDKTRAQWPFTMLNNQEVFAENGTKKSIGAPTAYYKALAPAQLNLNDAWNTVELTVHGSTDAEYKVNGTVVNRVFDMECNVEGTWAPLDQGPIALQAEWAEVYFRNLRIKVLP